MAGMFIFSGAPSGDHAGTLQRAIPTLNAVRRKCGVLVDESIDFGSSVKYLG